MKRLVCYHIDNVVYKGLRLPQLVGKEAKNFLLPIQHSSGNEYEFTWWKINTYNENQTPLTESVFKLCCKEYMFPKLDQSEALNTSLRIYATTY